jgi:hypothetical protein
MPRGGTGAGCGRAGEVDVPNRQGSLEHATLIVLQQELPVQLVNISRSGCLLQAPRPLHVGTVGRLRVALDGTEYADDVRVARCEPLDGAVSELGVELLWVAKPRAKRSSAPSLAMRLRGSTDGLAAAALRPKGT